MKYKCDHCDYASKRLCDLRRHENRKIPCNTKIKEQLCNIEVDANITPDPVYNSTNPVYNSTNPVYNSTNPVYNSTNPVSTFCCSKCKKEFTRKDNMKVHEKKCDGVDIKQCNTCLVMFTNYKAKWRHSKRNNCSPPASTINNNIDQSTTNNINNITNNTLNLNIQGNFNSITKLDIDKIVKHLGKSEYIKMIQKNLELGKYSAPETLKFIYFNDNHPELQTLKKERRNDKMVEVLHNGKWEKRLIDDIMKPVMKKVEECYNEYYKHVKEILKTIPFRSKEWNHIVRQLQTFGNTMIWYEGFLGINIEKLGIELNRLEDDKMSKDKNKDMKSLIKEGIYEMTNK